VGDGATFFGLPVADLGTIPNALSIARGISGPVLAAAVLADAPAGLVLVGVTAAGLSDWLDGYLEWPDHSFPSMLIMTLAKILPGHGRSSSSLA